MGSSDRVVMTQSDIEAFIAEVASAVVEKGESNDKLAVVGIREGGVWLSERLKEELERLSGKAVKRGLIDINLYRDDIGMRSSQPVVRSTEINFSLDDVRVLLVDDVLFTGRTIRAALSALVDLGRPRKVELAVLVDRGHRELPIAADYIGKTIETSRDEMVELEKTKDGKWQVVVRHGA